MPKKQQDFNFGDLIHKDSMLRYMFKTEPKIEGAEKRRRPQAFFLCECGSVCVKPITAVKMGKTKSCGCYMVKRVKESNTKHGNSSHELFHVWSKMIERCHRPTNKDYKDYGARGIEVCEEWRGPKEGFRQFVEDMGERPKGYTLERIDNDKGYFLENVKWASRRDQSLNRRKMKNNQSGKTGVAYDKKSKKWLAHIGTGNKRVNLIWTEDYDLAVFCREEAEIHYYGKLIGH